MERCAAPLALLEPMLLQGVGLAPPALLGPILVRRRYYVPHALPAQLALPELQAVLHHALVGVTLQLGVRVPPALLELTAPTVKLHLALLARLGHTLELFT